VRFLLTKIQAAVEASTNASTGNELPGTRSLGCPIVNALQVARKGGHVSLAHLLLRKVSSTRRPGREDAAVSIYACHQQTYVSQQWRELWLENRPISSLRLSMPPYNKPPPGVQLHEKAESYEIPVFGLHISRAIMECFDLPGVRDLAAELNVPLPKYDLSNFIQKKMFKVRTLIEEAGKRDDCQSGSNAEAVAKLERFVTDFEALQPSDIDGPDAWDRWVCQYAASDWMEKLEFSLLLSNFGFSAETAKQIQKTKIDDKKDDGTVGKVELEQYSLRWLSKAFAGYNVLGCLTDVANLLFAMKGPPPKKTPTEKEVVDTVREVCNKVKNEEFNDLWIPDHMVHDAETDDILAWLLLKHVHRRQETNDRFRVLVQLPTANVDFLWLEEVAKRIRELDCEVYRDPSARNAKAIKLAFPDA